MNIRTLPQLLASLLVIITPLRAAENFIEGGDPADGQMIFLDSRTVEAKIINQEVGAAVLPSFQLTMKIASDTAQGKANHISFKERIFVDPTKTYRLKALVSLDSAPLDPQFSGYGFDLDSKGIKNESGRAWEYYLRENEGAGTPGATVWACTIGPEDSGADYLWPEEIIAISFGIYFRAGEKGDRMEIQKVSFQEVP